MSQNISGFGLQINIIASVTFPNGFSVNAFADDADALDTPELAIGDSAMGLNGDHVVWGRPNPLDLTINVIPRSNDDVNLQILHEANRVGKNKSSAKDVISMSIGYPDGMNVSMSGGIIVSGELMPQVSNAGRMKSRPYHFRFEAVTRANM